MTKKDIDTIIQSIKQYINEILRGWGLSDEEKSLVAFEKEHMPYTRYSGNQSIDHVLFRKWLKFFAKSQKQRDNIVSAIKDSIAGGVSKEIVVVDSENALSTITNPKTEVIYITQDNNALFIWDGNSFANVTNQAVDNTIYVTNLNTLLEYDKEGIFTIMLTRSESNVKVYTLNVSVERRAAGLRYIPTLVSVDGWAKVVYDNDGQKKWEWHYYSYAGHKHQIADVDGLENALITTNEGIEKLDNSKANKADFGAMTITTKGYNGVVTTILSTKKGV